jgi:heptosyltransferase-2
MVLLTPALRALKTAYPQSHVTLLVRPLVAHLMTTHPYVNDIIVDPKGQPSSVGAESSKPLQDQTRFAIRNTQYAIRTYRKFLQEIRRRRFDLAVVLHPTSFRNALIPFLAGIPERIGSNVSGRGVLLTQSCRESCPCGTTFSSDQTDLHEVHRYLHILELIDIHDPSPHLEFWHTAADRQAVRQLLASHRISDAASLIGVNLGTTWPTKQWAIENFAAVIKRIRSRTDVPIVLTGSSGEAPFGEALLREIRNVEVINLIGKTTLMQLGALIERCKVYLTCDSGPMHIAAAVGTKTVALFGPTSPIRHRPLGEGHAVIEMPVDCRPCYQRTCQRKDYPHLCMTQIQPTAVAEEVLRRLL